MDEEELKKKLTPEQYKVLRQKGTETPFTGKYVHKGSDGTYLCMVCNNPLFSSDAQFDSGTGWLDPTVQTYSFAIVVNFDKTAKRRPKGIPCDTFRRSDNGIIKINPIPKGCSNFPKFLRCSFVSVMQGLQLPRYAL